MAKSHSRPDPEPEPEPEVSDEGVPSQSPMAPDAPGQQVEPGQDVRFKRLEGETDAEFEARVRHQVPVSESPTDVVPNRPNIGMGQPVAVPEHEEDWRYVEPPPGSDAMPATGGAGTTSSLGDQPGTENVRSHENPEEKKPEFETAARPEAEEPPA